MLASPLHRAIGRRRPADFNAAIAVEGEEGMKFTWFGVCMLILLGGPASVRAQSASGLSHSASASGLFGAKVAQRPQASQTGSLNDSIDSSPEPRGLRPGSLTVLPDDGRELYFHALDSAKYEIRIEICVLDDPQILQHLQAALQRGVRVRVIVDRGKYGDLAMERDNLAQYLTSSGGQLHLSNPIFPRSFPKIILVDSRLLVFGSACLDETTFLEYRDFAAISTDRQNLRSLQGLFENDWRYSAGVGEQPAAFNPTPPFSRNNLIISPVNGAERLVRLYQAAKRTLDVYTELLGNPTLESELVAAVMRGVRVRLIAPEAVNGGTPDDPNLQHDSLVALAAAGVEVHVSGPDQTAQMPYMHARAAVVDGKIAYLGSLSLSPDSITSNREMGLILHRQPLVRKLEAQFQSDFDTRTTKF
jgi:phosphatidylserine/phosphatidylglycerophosphate/cardiolipin synthase-like enzyme